MPALSRPAAPSHVLLPPRRALVATECDVLVVGGGPAGIGAALGAASAGADVVLAERYGFLGGNATVCLVSPWMSFRTRQLQPPRLTDADLGPSLLPNDHGEGEPVVGGKHVEVIERLVAAHGAIAPSLATGYTVPFDPEVFKTVALDLLDEAAVRYLLHAFASGVHDDGVVFETKSGPLLIRAAAVVDCTGDGDVAVAAGAECEIGREDDGLTQPMTLMARIQDFDRDAFAAYVAEHPDQWRGVFGLWDLVAQASAAGELDLPREDILFFATTHPREVALNSTRVTRVLGVDAYDLAYAEAVSRQQLRQIVQFLRQWVPGFADSYVVQSGGAIGVRETRRIVGDYVLTADDVLTARKFDDVVARGTYPIDIHSPTGRGTVLRTVPPGDAYHIPLRCLLPRGVDRVLTAGRCISGTHEAHSSYRVTPTAMATGQAAGVCAALAARVGRAPRKVPVDAVQAELRRQGADLGEGGEVPGTSFPASGDGNREKGKGVMRPD